MKAAIYCRVSTSRQEEEGTSLETQLAHCRAYAVSYGHEVDDSRVFLEQASGADMEICYSFVKTSNQVGLMGHLETQTLPKPSSCNLCMGTKPNPNAET